MSTMNFSIPDRVKEEFNQYHAGENKSAVITRLMEESIEEKKRLAQRAEAMDAILEFRKLTKPISTEEILCIKQECRD